MFENQDKIVIVMEYASGGELYEYLASKSGITDDEARGFFRQIVSAVRYCHQVRRKFKFVITVIASIAEISSVLDQAL